MAKTRLEDFEHTADVVVARAALVALRKRAKRLHFISGGRGYDNMGARELEQLRTKIDETEFWLSAATRSLNAGGERAQKLGLGQPSSSALEGDPDLGEVVEPTPEEPYVVSDARLAEIRAMVTEGPRGPRALLINDTVYHLAEGLFDLLAEADARRTGTTG